MSKITGKKAVTVRTIASLQEKGQKISMVTCYDAAFARILNHCDLDMILVGDSLGNVILGEENTLKVTMDDMVRHTSAVSKTIETAMVCADMPFLSYNISSAQALENAGRLIAEGGAQAVKLEGGTAITKQVESIVSAGIPVVGHLGLTPQSIHQLGGYRVQGREDTQAKELIENAKALQDAGAFCLVLEMVPRELAKTVTENLSIPTIGIGAGEVCSGQVLVLHDLLGFDPDFTPKFLKRYANLHDIIKDAVNAYSQDVKSGKFPGEDHSF